MVHLEYLDCVILLLRRSELIPNSGETKHETENPSDKILLKSYVFWNANCLLLFNDNTFLPEMMLPTVWWHLNIPKYIAVVLYVVIKVTQAWNVLEVQGLYLFKVSDICLEWLSLLGCTFSCVLDKLIEAEMMHKVTWKKLTSSPEWKLACTNLCYVSVLHFLKPHRKSPLYFKNSNLFHSIFPSVYEW